MYNTYNSSRVSVSTSRHPNIHSPPSSYRHTARSVAVRHTSWLRRLRFFPRGASATASPLRGSNWTVGLPFRQTFTTVKLAFFRQSTSVTLPGFCLYSVWLIKALRWKSSLVFLTVAYVHPAWSAFDQSLLIGIGVFKPSDQLSPASGALVVSLLTRGGCSALYWRTLFILFPYIFSINMMHKVHMRA